MKTINDSPKIYTKKNFISDEDCMHFINLSKDNIQPSLVSGDKQGYISEGRTGKNYWIKHDYDEITLKVANKIANEVGYPLENAEAFQVIYYDKSEEYRQHYDGWLFDDSEKSKRNMKYGGQRMKTCLVYLNDVELGGGTKFTKLNLEVNAEKCKLLVFDNVHSGINKRHELSEHCGMPVFEGEKWAFNLWFREESREKLYNYKPDNEIVSFLEKDREKYFNKVENSNEIKEYSEILSSKDLLKILNITNFEDKERSSIWINKEKIYDIIKKIEKLVNIDSSYFESMCVTKYAPNTIHRDHLDAYDLETAKGKEYTNKTGKRLITITGFISDVIVTFPKLYKKFNMKKGNLIVYNNCYNESNLRNKDMIKNYSPLTIDNESTRNLPMILFNIYIRERSMIKEEILSITNGNIEKIIEKKEEIKCNLSSEELINMIYRRNPFENLRIPGFKLTNKASIDFVEDTLSKIKNLRDNLNNQFLNPVNLEKEYFIDEYNPVIVEDVVSPEIHKIVDEYFKTNIKNGVYPFGDRQSQRYKIIDEIMTRLLHLEFLPLIEKIVGRKMEATYTYISAYVKGADLPPHTDRPECEFTCSYIIGKPPDTNWNIYIHKEKQAEKYKGRYNFTPPKEECIAVDCRENGLMIFNGTDHIHYREPLEHEYYNVVLLHYKGNSSM